MGMKGWSLFRFRSKHLSIFITVLVGTTILLWSWENSPLFISLLSPHDQILVASSETLRDTTTHVDSLPSTDLKVQSEKTLSDSFTTSETIERAEGVDVPLKSSTSVTIERAEGVDVPLKSSSSRDSTKTSADYTISPANEKVFSDLFTSTETRERTDGVNIPPPTSDTIFSKSRADDMESFGNGKAFSESTTENREQTEGSNIPPPSLPATNSLKSRADDIESFQDTKDCNYAKGKWIADSGRPLYSGFGCKQWLSQMWACRLTQRTDFSYEAFRWQPQDCRMPEFERSEFLQRMKGKTIAFVGDSLGRQQFQSLMCMVSGGEEVPDIHNIGRQYGLVKARGAIRPEGWAYRFPSSNTVILYYWSATLCDLKPLNITDPKTEYALHLDRPTSFLSKYLHTFDVLILNTGHHWNRGKFVGNRWVMYVNGVPNTDEKLAQIGSAKEFAVRSVVKWLDSQLLQHPRLKAFFRTISPRHFVNGDWNTGGTCDNTVPLAGGSEVLQDKSSDPVIENALNGSRVKILDITAISQLRDDGHLSRYTIRPVEGMQDCLHWCLPGIPDTWNELLYAQL